MRKVLLISAITIVSIWLILCLIDGVGLMNIIYFILIKVLFYFCKKIMLIY